MKLLKSVLVAFALVIGLSGTAFAEDLTYLGTNSNGTKVYKDPACNVSDNDGFKIHLYEDIEYGVGNGTGDLQVTLCTNRKNLCSVPYYRPLSAQWEWCNQGIKTGLDMNDKVSSYKTVYGCIAGHTDKNYGGWGIYLNWSEDNLHSNPNTDYAADRLSSIGAIQGC